MTKPDELVEKVKAALREQFPLGDWLPHYENIIAGIAIRTILSEIQKGEVVDVGDNEGQKCVELKPDYQRFLEN